MTTATQERRHRTESFDGLARKPPIRLISAKCATHALARLSARSHNRARARSTMNTSRPTRRHASTHQPVPPPQASGLLPAQVATLRERLIAERARLLGEAEETLAPVRGPRERSTDEVDEAEETVEESEAIGLAELDRERLELVERALAKIEAGTYGVSELSGEPIGYARLDAMPWARLSMAEQEDLERVARG
jgi:DnaK suppressor protein